MRCIFCNSEDTFFSKKRNKFVCEECERDFAIETEPVTRRIFISYGHDAHWPLAERLYIDLSHRKHDVWYDKAKLTAGIDWEENIEKAFEWLAEERSKSVLLLLLTPYSVRRPDGYCLNEVAKALDLGLQIIPIMVVDSDPPLSICRIQWLDMRACIPINEKEAHYQPCFDRLIKALEEGKLDFEGSQNRLLNVLSPISFSVDIVKLLKEFTGREWIINRIRDWFNDPDGEKIFWIKGAPGVGKSAISAWLRDNQPEISAFHFCDINSEEKRNPAKMVVSIVYQLSTQLHQYQQQLIKMPLEDITKGYQEAYTLFDKLIVQPLNNYSPGSQRPIVILIDAIDEATFNKQNEIAKFIRLNADKTPSWVKFLITSRPEPEILSSFQSFDPFVLDTANDHNIDDLALYIKKQLPSITQKQIDSILNNSEGVFLYVKSVCEEITSGRLSLDNPDQFPKGLGDIYKEFFDRQFKDDLHYYEDEIRTLLYPILAAYEPLTLNFLREYGGYRNKNELFDRLDRLGSLFPASGEDKNDTIKPFHRSLMDWVTNKAASYPYFIDVHYGHEILSEFGWKLFISGEIMTNDYFLPHLADHLIVIGDWNRLSALLTDITFFDCYYKESKKHELMKFWRFLINHENPTKAFQHSIDGLIKKGIDLNRLYNFTYEIAQLLKDMGLPEDALPFAQKSLNIRRDMMGQDDKKIADIQREIADIYRLLKDFDRALLNYTSALEIYQQQLGENCAEVATIYHDLAVFYRDRNDYSLAIKYNKQSLTIRENLIPKDVPAVADCINNTGVLIFESSKDEDVIPYYEKALKLFRKYYGQKHYDMANVIGNIGLYYLNTSDSEDGMRKAAACFKQAYEMACEFRVMHQHEVCTMRRLLIKCYNSLGQIAEMIPLQKEEVRSKEILEAAGSIEILIARAFLATIYEKSGRVEESIKVQTEIFNDYRKFGKEHYRLAAKDVQTLFEQFRNAALHFIHFHKYGQTEEIYSFLLEQEFQRAGIHCHLARLYYLMGKEDQARHHIEKVSDYQHEAAPYISARILYFRILSGMLDGHDITALHDEMTKILENKEAHLEWTIDPVLEIIKPRLSDTDFRFLKEIADRINTC